MCNKVNGWSNCPTWNWNLHNDGDYWGELAQEIYDNAEAGEYLSKRDEAIHTLEERLRDECEEEYETQFGNLTGAFGDIFQWAIDNIDFREIAENLMEDVDMEEKEEESEEE